MTSPEPPNSGPGAEIKNMQVTQVSHESGSNDTQVYVKPEPGSSQADLNVSGLSEDGEVDMVLDEEGIEDDDFQAKFQAILEGMGEPYDPAAETLADAPAYRPSFREVERSCTQILAQLATIFEKANYSDNCTKQLHASISEKKTIQYPEPKRIALYGASGVGKSSLINSLLNSPDLCSSGGTGKACTCVITEYAQARDTQVEPFEAEILLFDTREINEMLQEHYRHFYEWYHLSPATEGDELDIVQSLGTKALAALSSLFVDRVEFLSDQSATDFLGADTTTDDASILSTMSEWTLELIARHESEAGVIRVSATTADELQCNLEPFVMENEVSGDDTEGIPQSSIWQLVRLVRVGLRSELLSRGLIIADLPGSGDTNRTRTRTTQRYIRNCAWTVVVAPLSRILTDQATHDKLTFALKKPGKNKTLICTMIDCLGSDTKARRVTKNRNLLLKHERLEALWKAKKKDLQDLTKSIRSLKGDEKREVDYKLSVQAKEVKIYESMVVSSLVEMNNAKIRGGILETLEKKSQVAPELEVFFVSNKCYKTHLDGYSEDKIPLPLAMTGIPELRGRLSSIPAKERFKVVQHYFKGTLHGQLCSAKIWCTQSSTDRKDEIRSHVEKPSKAAVGLIQSYVQDMEFVLRKILLQVLDNAKPAWIESGLKAVEAWEQMHPQSFGAWCRRSGAHETKKYPYRNWNVDLTETVEETVKKAWPAFNEELRRCKGDMLEKLILLLDGIRTDLKGIPGVSIVPMTPFLMSLPSKKEDLLRHLDRAFTALEEVSSRAETLSTTAEPDGLIMEGMSPIYEKMVNVSGIAIGIQRKTLLKDAMTRGEPFAKILPRLQALFEEAFSKEQEKLAEDLGKVFNGIVEDFDQQFMVEDVPDQERDNLKAKVLDYVNYAEGQLDGVIEVEFAKAVKGRS